GTKHGNAGGAAVSDTPVEAVRLMLTGDTRAIFGGGVMLGLAIDEEVAEALGPHASSGRTHPATLAAASFPDEAIELLARKQGKCRVLANPALGKLDRGSIDTAPR